MDESEHPRSVHERTTCHVSRMPDRVHALRHGEWQWPVRWHATNHTVVCLVDFNDLVEQQDFGVVREIRQKRFVEWLRHVR